MFEEYRELIELKIDEQIRGNVFHLSELMGDSWPSDKGVAAELGKAFRRNLANFPTIVDAGKNDRNWRLYQKL